MSLSSLSYLSYKQSSYCSFTPRDQKKLSQGKAIEKLWQKKIEEQKKRRAAKKLKKSLKYYHLSKAFLKKGCFYQACKFRQKALALNPKVVHDHGATKVSQQEFLITGYVRESYHQIIPKEIERLLLAFSQKLFAFGPQQWKKCGVHVKNAPALPIDIEQILNGPCPFWTGMTVEETHVLALINGKLSTLNFAGKILDNYQKDRTWYTKSVVQKSKISECYWVLMTRDVIPKSLDKTYDQQKALVCSYPGYDIPTALEAITAISGEYLMNKRMLYSVSDANVSISYPSTYTRCQESFQGNPLIVGGFSNAKLQASTCNNDNRCSQCGVSGLRRLKIPSAQYKNPRAASI
ncbi:MAG: hypothetical protein AAF443_03775 [Chlamydiota bacterium]